MPLQHQAFEAFLYATGLTNETLTEFKNLRGTECVCPSGTEASRQECPQGRSRAG